MPSARPAEVREHLIEMLAPVVASTGHDLEDVTVSVAGRRSQVKVVVDADGGVDLDAVADVTRAVSAALDDADDGGFAGPYTLEVSSPGVDRPLTEPRHWRRAADRLVRTTVDGDEVTGRVLTADDATVSLAVGGTVRQVGFARLGAGHVQIEFNRSGED